jgi:hypothetical protein
MKTIFSILIFSIGIQFVSMAQKGTVEIIKDTRIDGLVYRQGAIIPPNTSPQISGYRIHLFFDSNKSLVDKARIDFISKYPKVDAYVVFRAPNYFLKVGDFRAESEAQKVKKEIKADYPTAFVVREMINLPRID